MLQVRGQKHLPELQDIKSIGVNNIDTIARETETLTEMAPANFSDEEAKDILIGKLRLALSLEEDDEENLFSLKLKALTRLEKSWDVILLFVDSFPLRYLLSGLLLTWM